MLISRPATLRICRIWWPSQRFVAIACSCRSQTEGESHRALTQESLRVHPVAVDLVRMPIQDDVLPLTKPVVGTSGRVYTELPVPKGTPVTVSISGYSL